MPKPASEVTDLLDAWSAGDTEALTALMPLVYDELRRIAAYQFRRENKGHTLQPTEVVHEAFMRFKGQRRVQWQSRTEFFAVAAKMIRRVLVDHARRRSRLKRGGDVPKIPFEEAFGVSDSKATGVVAVHDALKELARIAQRQSDIVELKIFGGLTFEAIASTLEVSRSTVIRDWNAALLWLRRELHRD